MILGLDISTSITGLAVLEKTDNGYQVLEAQAIELQKIGNNYAKAAQVASALQNVKSKFNVTDIFIEENLQAFRSGFSSAKTLVTLARFNGIVSYLCHDTFDIFPEFLNVNSARKSVGLKLVSKKKGGKPTKEQVFEWVKSQNSMNMFEWPIKTLKSGPRKGMSVFDNSCYDIADAFVIALAGMNK